MDITTRARRLAALAKADPAALSASGWQTVKAANLPEGRLFPTAADAPGGFDTGARLQHPSGLIVHGPGATEAIRQARGEVYNSAVYAVIRSKAEAYVEPQLRVWRGPYGDIANSDIVADHPANAIIQRDTSEWLTTLQFRLALRWGLDTWGDYYAVKIRGGGGSVIDNTTGVLLGLWGIPGDSMMPARRRGAPAPITHYVWDIGGGKTLDVPLENVVHWRNGVDPRNPLVGLGPLRLIAREVLTDTEADAFVHFFLRNSGVPGLVFSPADGQVFGQPLMESIKNSVSARTSGAHRGDVFVLPTSARVEQFQFDPGAMDLGPVWRHTESRIAAVLGWPAFLAGLQVGQELKYSNAREAREAATETTLLSHWQQDGQVWDRALRGAFRLRPDEYIAHDWLNVRALQDDMQLAWQREAEQLDRGVLTRDEWRAARGWGDLPEGDNGLLVGDKANIIALIQAVGEGRVSPASARETLVAAFRLPPDVAGRMIPDDAAPVSAAASAPQMPAKAHSGPIGAFSGAEGMAGKADGARALEAAAAVSAEDVDAAVAAWDRWAADSAPEFSGMLG